MIIGLGTIGSILLGICVITGLIKSGEIGCLGYLLILVLALILLGALFVSLLMSVGGEML